MLYLCMKKHNYPHLFCEVIITPDTYLETLPSRLGTTNAVYNQLKVDYKKKDIAWVLAATWQGPALLDTNKVDTSHKKRWNIDKQKVKKFARMMSDEGYHKPIILVSIPNSSKLICIDGHHHLLAAIKLGTQVMAYIAVVGSIKGPWETIRKNLKRGKTDANDEFDTD
jgi:hypothetical protein